MGTVSAAVATVSGLWLYVGKALDSAAAAAVPRLLGLAGPLAGDKRLLAVRSIAERSGAAVATTAQGNGPLAGGQRKAGAEVVGDLQFEA